MMREMSNDHLVRVFELWQSLRIDGDVPGIRSLTLDNMPKTLRNVLISEMRGSEMILHYQGEDLSAAAGKKLEGQSYWDIMPEHEAPRWFTGLRLMLETPCAMYGAVVVHTGKLTIETGMLGLPIRAPDGAISHWLTAIAQIQAEPQEKPIPVGAPVPFIELKEVRPIDIGFGAPEQPL